VRISRFVSFLKNGIYLVLIAGLLLSLPLLSYCASPAQPTVVPSSASTTATSPSPTVTSPSPALTPTEGLVKAIRRTDQWPPYLDPAVGNDFLSAAAYVNIYDTLVFPNPEGGIKPWLAKSWTISDDGLTYTFELEQGVKFHNGDELTADDVVFSLQRIKAMGSGFAFLFKAVKEAKSLDQYKVQFTLDQPYGPFLGILVRLGILNKKQVMANIKTGGSFGEFGDYGKDWLVSHDAGSGPYKLNEIKTEEYFLLEKFEGYWAGWDNKDAPQYIKWIGITEAITVRTLFSRGELEITDQWQTPENYAAIGQLPNAKVVTYFGGQVMSVFLNMKKPPTDDIHFRKALTYCMDSQQIIDTAFPGSRIVAGPVPPDILGSDPNLKPYTFDLTKAEEELKQSPYYGKLDQYPVEVSPPAEGGPNYEKIALMLQANAAKIGIKVNVTKIPWGTMVANMSKPETTPNGTVLMTASDYNEAGSLLYNRYHSSGLGTTNQGEWLGDPEIDKMIEDALVTVDQTARLQKYYTIQEKIVDLCPTIYLLETAIKQAYRSDIVVFPAAEAISQGKPVFPIAGFNNYYRDYKVTPEKAQQPYIPFKP
jgi:peptide/nickel transport system substrate-binding protein